MSARPMLAALVLLMLTHPAFAHALLRRAIPAVGASVNETPSELVLIFTEAVEPGFSSVTVTGADAARHDTGSLRTDPRDGTHLLVAVGKLPPGLYTVTWHVTSVDTHKTEGVYQFTVRP